MMNITHDPENNIAYIRFLPKMTGIETIEVSSEINVDLAPDGTLYGIELLNANEQMKGIGSVIAIEKQQSQQRRDLPL